ncbi:flagellar hook-length control protein FliK [Noviherbaspirillum sp.]|uniref:flagellar hook-length control protein FliK n=1 Tax=Noviherbaspirillum sp. TaxID=1926288 RepID=UPI002FE1B058
MLPRADLRTSRPVIAVEAATPVLASADARQDIFHRLTQIALGKELLATVQSRFDDGTFSVKVGDTAARMALPVGTRVGDNLPMALVSKGPRPTFLLLQQTMVDTASVSPAGRLIDQILQLARQDNTQASVVAKTPLATTASDIDPQHVAARLQSEVAESGVFYESHLHEWATGRRPLASLLQEPQAALAEHGHGMAARGTTGGDVAAPDARLLSASPSTPSGNTETRHAAESLLPDLANDVELLSRLRDMQGLPQNKDLDADVLVYNKPAADDSGQHGVAQNTSAPETIKPEAARIVNLQLHTLEQQQVRWQGELWPGVPMQWEVGRQTATRENAVGKDGAGGVDYDQASWTSVVRFELPTLGPVAARIILSGDRVQVRVSAASEDTAEALRAHGAALADAMLTAGSPLDHFMVKVNETP